MKQINFIEENALAYYKGIARLLDGQYVKGEEVTWFTTERRSLFRFNGVIHTALSRAEKLGGVVDPLLDMFLSQNLPFFWVDWPVVGTPGLGEYLSKKPIPFMRLNGIPAMLRALDDLPELLLPNEVEIIRVQNEEDRSDWLNVLMEGFEEPEPARPDIQQFLARSLTEPQPVFEHFLARWQGKPCATSTLLHSNQMAGIYNVTTLPAYRGCGLGRTLTLAAMQSARDAGHSEVMLFATTAGFPVYKRLGFETVSTADLFIWNGNG